MSGGRAAPGPAGELWRSRTPLAVIKGERQGGEIRVGNSEEGGGIGTTEGWKSVRGKGMEEQTGDHGGKEGGEWEWIRTWDGKG